MTHREFEGWDAHVERLAIATRTGNPGWAQLPQSKRVMIDEGGTLFFTGAPCKRGHVSPRNQHGDCTQCHLMRLGSRLIDNQSQNMTVAARATAERKTLGHLS